MLRYSFRRHLSHLWLKWTWLCSFLYKFKKRLIKPPTVVDISKDVPRAYKFLLAFFSENVRFKTDDCIQCIRYINICRILYFTKHGTWCHRKIQRLTFPKEPWPNTFSNSKSLGSAFWPSLVTLVTSISDTFASSTSLCTCDMFNADNLSTLSKQVKLCSHGSTYSLNCHGGAVLVFHKVCKITRSKIRTESVSGHKLTTIL